MLQGRIIKSDSGYYYVDTEGGELCCRARGRFRKTRFSPLVGDLAEVEPTEEGKGYIVDILPRKNRFVRPAVANIDLMVILASSVTPVTDPFLVDRVSVMAEYMGCGVVICINKCDLDPGEGLYRCFSAQSAYPVLRTSAATGEGVEELRRLLSGHVAAFTGNSGVGKSSLLNRLSPELGLSVGEVSAHLGRGRHTTRHVTLFPLDAHTLIADTPGFSSFDPAQMEPIPKEGLQRCFPEFLPFLGCCRFEDCAHLKEPGCAVLAAVGEGRIAPSRHESYRKLYAISAAYNAWGKK